VRGVDVLSHPGERVHDRRYELCYFSRSAFTIRLNADVYRVTWQELERPDVDIRFECDCHHWSRDARPVDKSDHRSIWRCPTCQP
jgi:hypothetical protein